MKRRKLTILSGLLASSVLLTGVGASVYLVMRWREWSGNELTRLWQKGEYESLSQFSEKRLATDPFDVVANVFGGLGYFYASLGSEAYLEAWPDLSRSVQLIRRALALQPDIAIAGQLYYILGKSYSRMGGQYLDLAPRYFELSLRRNYVNDDSYESIALSYLRIQDHARSLAYFSKVKGGEDSDEFLLALAESLREIGRVKQAQEKLLHLLDVAQNDRSKQDGLLQLAEIHYNEGLVTEAKEGLEQALSYGARPDLLYLLGDIYRQQGDEVRARAQWRAALRIDPGFTAARSRLTES